MVVTEGFCEVAVRNDGIDKVEPLSETLNVPSRSFCPPKVVVLVSRSMLAKVEWIDA